MHNSKPKFDWYKKLVDYTNDEWNNILPILLYLKLDITKLFITCQTRTQLTLSSVYFTRKRGFYPYNNRLTKTQMSTQSLDGLTEETNNQELTISHANNELTNFRHWLVDNYPNIYDVFEVSRTSTQNEINYIIKHLHDNYPVRPALANQAEQLIKDKGTSNFFRTLRKLITRHQELGGK